MPRLVQFGWNKIPDTAVWSTMARTELRSVYFIIDLLAPDWDIHSAPGRWADLCDEIRRWVYWSQMAHSLNSEQEKV